MRKSSTYTAAKDGPPDKLVRATFTVPRPLYLAFCEAAKQKDQTFSQEMRKHMREYVEAENAA